MALSGISAAQTNPLQSYISGIKKGSDKGESLSDRLDDLSEKRQAQSDLAGQSASPLEARLQSMVEDRIGTLVNTKA